MTRPYGALLVMLLAGGPNAPQGEVSLPIDLSRFEVRGKASAPVLVVEFSDFKCQACEKFSLTVMPNLAREFLDKGLLKVAFVDFPLVDEAGYLNAAESPYCAGKQGKYWQMHDALWSRTDALGDPDLERYAEEIGLDVPAFRKCLATDVFVPTIRDHLELAHRLGLSSRPTFFVGRRGPGGEWRGRYVVGTQSYVIFKSLITRMLGEGKSEGEGKGTGENAGR